MKKIIFFDIDGTLITEDEYKIIPESTRHAIKKARENGHLTFINTGRTIFNIGEEIRSLGFDGYLCGCGTYIEYHDKELFYNKLNCEYCKKLSEKIRECGAIPVYERRDCLFFDPQFDDTPEIKEFKEVFLTSDIPTNRTVSDEDFSFDKFVVYTNENTDLESFKNTAGKDFMLIDRGNGFFENVPKGFSKATAIDMILRMLDIPLENAYAIGDSTNDLPMLKAVPNSIAMGNSDKIYPYVSFVTKPIMEDGIEHALKHYGII